MTGKRTRTPATATILLLLVWTLIGEQRAAGAEDGATTKNSSAFVGVVRFDGPRPKRKPIQMMEKGGKLSDCRELHKAVLLDENVMVSEQGEVANVFVYVKRGLEKKKTYPVPKNPAVLSQEKCMFQPRVQGIQVGQEFVMKNGDPLLHNIRSFSLRNRAFNIAQPANTPDRKKVFTRSEKAVKIQCDIHPWMTAYYFVMEHPYFAVTNQKGQFRIEGLPPGEYTLAAWHEELGKQDVKSTLATKGPTKVAFSFKGKTQ